MTTVLKNHIKKVLNGFGLELRRIPSAAQHPIQRWSLSGVLQHAKAVGFTPATILDVGAAYGAFTSTCRTIFPDSRYLLIETLGEYYSFLQTITCSMPDAEFVNAAVTDKSGNVVIHVHPDLVGSSLYKEEEDSDVNGVKRIVPAVSLDDLCSDKNTRGPYLLKIDTQGAEIKVLSGAQTVLKEIALILLEVSLFEFFKGGPLLYDCITFMKEKGFVVYDIFDFQYRLLDGAMSQIDIAFVQENGLFRKFHCYATRAQREQQTKMFRGE